MDPPRASGFFSKIPLKVWILVALAVLVAFFVVKYWKYMKYLGPLALLAALAPEFLGTIIAGLLGASLGILAAAYRWLKKKFGFGADEEEAGLEARDIIETDQNARASVQTDGERAKLDEAAEKLDTAIDEAENEDDLDDAKSDYDADVADL